MLYINYAAVVVIKEVVSRLDFSSFRAIIVEPDTRFEIYSTHGQKEKTQSEFRDHRA